MAEYRNGQSNYNNSAAGQYHNHYGRRAGSFDNGTETHFRPNGNGNNGYNYLTLPDRSNSIAARQNAELFMGSVSPSLPPPQVPGSVARFHHRHQVSSPPVTQPGYNPQSYGQPMSPTASYGHQPYNGLARPPGAAVPGPYNPAAYADSELQRFNSSAGHSRGLSSGAYPTSPTYSPSRPQHVPMPTLPAYPQTHMGGSTQTPYDHEYTYQSPAYFSHPSSASLSPRPSINSPSGLAPLPPDPRNAASPHDGWGRLSEQYQSSVQSSPHYSRHSNSTSRDRNSLPSPPVPPGHGSRHGSTNRVDYTPSPLIQSDSSFPPTPGPVPPPHMSPQRTNTNRHPQQRPLPGPPPDSDNEPDYFTHPNGTSYDDLTAEQIAQEELYEQVELLTGTSPSAASHRRMRSQSYETQSSMTPLQRRGTGDHMNQATNGFTSPVTGQYGAYDYSDDSDPEGAAGLAALRMAEEEERAEEARRQSGGSGLFRSYTARSPPAQPMPVEEGEDSDYIGVDMSTYGGGFDAHMSYGGDPSQLAVRYGSLRSVGDRSQPVSSTGSTRRSGQVSEADAYDYGGSIHPFPPFAVPTARVDEFGTGGLSEPTAHRRRLSYDEGDETGFVDDQMAATAEPPEMFYHPGVPASRPLPPPPLVETHSAPYPADWRNESNLQSPQPSSFPITPDSYTVGPAGNLVPRSTSLLSHSSTPPIVQPLRSRTDAEERRRQQQLRQSYVGKTDSSGENTANTSAVALDLPTLPAGRRFNPAKLTPTDFKRCTEPWALSSIISWLKSMCEGEADLKEQAIVDGLVALFTHKVPTMNIADAETLSARVVQDMYKAGTLVHEEEWLKFSSETMTGVIFQLTGAGCYAPKLHTYSMSGRCYAYHCQRTLKKIDLHAQPALRQTEDWATYYKVKKEDLEGVPKKDIERQYVLHEIVTSEDFFMEQLNVVRTLYRDALQNAQPPLISPKRLKAFLRDVFGKIDAVKKANEDFLLPQLKYRQQEQGPWITGFSDIFREWIRKAKGAYIEYAAAFPGANLLVRQEAERNILFRTFLDNVRNNKLSNKLGWDTYLKAPITRLQRYSLLLNTVYNQTPQDSEEKRNLQIAIDEIKTVTLECDARVAEMTRKVDLTDLQSKLKLRPGMQRVELNLDHLGRQLIFRGDLQRTGANRFTWLETHALLFDHYLVLAKKVSERDAGGGTKYERYDVSKLPIPMDLLVLESTDDEPVIKGKGIASVTTVTTRTASAPDTRGGRAPSNQSPAPGGLSHINTNSSLTSVSTTVTDASKDDRTLYPFRVKHLGKEVYTLYAATALNRKEWCDKIIEAKTRHAAALFSQNAEPFKLRVIADSAFAYDGGSAGQRSVMIRGTPLDRAIQEVESMFANTARPSPICRARVNCATAFTQAGGKPMVAVGTDFGVYISEVDNPRGWSRVIPTQRVTQIAVLEEFSLFLLIADKSLIAYHLDVVCPVGGAPAANDSALARRAPQKLSGSRDVGFFATGKMKDRTLVIYKKREGLSSTFKVLEPVFQKSTSKQSRFLRTARTEFFREYDEFYIPAECSRLDVFHTSLAISTARGFEVLTLDKKQPWSVPDLKQPAVATIAQRLQGQSPLGMFRLSEQEFLLCYEECGVYVNKTGDISRSVVMEFVGRAKAAAVAGAYVLLFDSDFVEIRNAQNGRLRQVIAGREVKCLDDGMRGGNEGERTVKICLQHPEAERWQVVVELVLNEGLKE